MCDPLSIAGIAVSAIQILTPLIEALKNAYDERGSAHQTLDELKADTIAICELLDHIRQLCSVPTFVAGVEELQKGTRANLLDNLEQHIRGCHTDAQRLCDVLRDIGIEKSQSRFQLAKLQYRLNDRADDIFRIKQRFQDHKSSIQLALQVVTMYVPHEVFKKPALICSTQMQQHADCRRERETNNQLEGPDCRLSS
jgi:hypothetical protein